MIVIPGFTPSYRVPTVAAINEFGAGKTSVGSIPLACVLFGNKISGGNGALNQRYPITTDGEAAERFGDRSELANMCYAALEAGGSGLSLYGVAVSEAAGGTAATLPIDIGGTWTASGELTIQIDHEIIRVTVGASHTPTTFGDALHDAILAAQNGRLFCTAVNTAGRVVLTVGNVGVRGNQHLVFLDTSKLPSGMTVVADQNSDVVRTGTGPANGVTITGVPTSDISGRVRITTGGVVGTALFSWYVDGGTTPVATGVVSATNVTLGATGLTAHFAAGTYVVSDNYDWSSFTAVSKGTPFYGGAGTDDIDPALDALDNVQNDYIAAAQNDSVNVGVIKAHVGAKAAFDIGLLEMYVVCTNRGLSAAITIGQVAMNDALGEIVWPQNHPEHPSLIAARIAAMRSVTEGTQPNTNWDAVVVKGACAHYIEADSPNRATQNAALNAGVTPLATVNGELQIVRAITSRSLNGSTPDDRTYDVSEAVVPIRVRKELVALGESLRKANPFSGPDVAVGLPPDGIFTPRLWISAATQELKIWESSEFNWIADVDANPMQAVWDTAGKRVMSIVPLVVATHFHSLGIVVRQTAA